ncbi:hypothetical protein GIB67_030253 [Kingdonia uniflora]|uniref:Uncharacterized protein n=1 Tax=Kingdonia uniflora TaxID=39325 RepID=A0A7J7MN79_9MAGN|nr:hypothetical protein GIB67_030253 [Kingdonia uniflora]
MEYSMMGEEILGPGRRVYELLGGLTLVCACSCFYLSVKPGEFFTEVALSVGLVFKGTWVLQAALSLYSDMFSLKGCHTISLSSLPERNVPQCDLEEDGLRGVALINLLFVGHAIGVMVMSFVLFGALSCNRNLRCGEGSGPLMAEIGSESLLMRPLPELEME